MADDDDYDVVGNDEVVDALRDVEKAIKEKWSGQWSGVVVCVVLLWAWYVVKDIWHSKWRLGLTYDVSSDKVLVDKTPHDCAFLAAPMGEKYCHYDRVVTTLRWSTSTNGEPIASYDEGKSWSVFTPDAGSLVPRTSAVQQVYVSWTKVEE